jgi:hypothetical protein
MGSDTTNPQVVGHQHVSMNDELVTLGSVEKRFLEELAVFVVGENRLAVVAAQDDVLWYAFGEVARKSGHDARLA